MAQLFSLGDERRFTFMTTPKPAVTFSHPCALRRTLKGIAIGWIVSCFFCFIPDGWMSVFLGWFGAEPMPHAIFMRYCLDGGGLIIGGVGVVIWVAATDIVRYRPIVIAITALHLIAAPVFYVMDTTVGMPLWWRVMDFGSFLVGGGLLLAFWLWPSKPSPNQSPEPTAVGAVRSAVAVHIASRRWLSCFR